MMLPLWLYTVFSFPSATYLWMLALIMWRVVRGRALNHGFHLLLLMLLLLLLMSLRGVLLIDAFVWLETTCLGHLEDFLHLLWQSATNHRLLWVLLKLSTKELSWRIPTSSHLALSTVFLLLGRSIIVWLRFWIRLFICFWSLADWHFKEAGSRLDPFLLIFGGQHTLLLDRVEKLMVRHLLLEWDGSLAVGLSYWWSFRWVSRLNLMNNLLCDILEWKEARSFEQNCCVFLLFDLHHHLIIIFIVLTLLHEFLGRFLFLS